MTTLLQRDLRHALRALRASPGFAAAAVLLLGLGIGATTAVFSLWYGVLYSPLPGVASPEQLAIITNPNVSGMWRGRWVSSIDGPRGWLTVEEFEQLRDNARTRLYGVAAQDPLTVGFATGVLLAVAFMAAYVPAARAAKTDPISALR